LYDFHKKNKNNIYRMSTGPYIMKSGLGIPGAYLLNTSTGSFPIYYTISNYANYFMNDCDDAYLIMPGFRIIVYVDGYDSDAWDSGQNDNGYPICLATSHVNRGSSCRLYYKGTQIGSD
jgi:hypothetical protein